MLTKQQRRKNWASIERALGRCSSNYVNRQNKTAMRRYYVDEEKVACLKVKSGQDIEISLDVLLLLDPKKFEDDTADIDAGNAGGAFTSESRDFMELQGGMYGGWLEFYFGNNSLYCRRESEIYEKYFSHRKSSVAIKYKPFLDLLISTTITQISRIQVNPYCQIWREDQKRFEQLKKRASVRFIFNYKRHVHQLSFSFCLIEWAYRYPDKFDQTIRPIVKYFRDFYVNTNFPIRKAYEYTIKERLADWAESEAAGGKMYIAIQYDSQQLLENYLPLLSPETRYPCHPSDESETIRSLPPIIGNRGNRIAYKVVAALWEAGFAVNREIRLAENVLFLEIDVPLSVARLGHLLKYDYLVSNVEGLEEQIEAQTSVISENVHRETTGKLVYYLEPLQGKPRVGALAWVDDHPYDKNQLKELEFSNDYAIKNVVSNSKPEEFVPSLLKYREYICDRGSMPPWETARTPNFANQ